MRAEKEKLVVLPSDIAVGAHQYQYFCERALAGLSESERKVILLRFWECLPIAKIADHIGRSWSETNLLIDSSVEKIRATFKKLSSINTSELSL